MNKTTREKKKWRYERARNSSQALHVQTQKFRHGRKRWLGIGETVTVLNKCVDAPTLSPACNGRGTSRLWSVLRSIYLHLPQSLVAVDGDSGTQSRRYHRQGRWNDKTTTGKSCFILWEMCSIECVGSVWCTYAYGTKCSAIGRRRTNATNRGRVG